MSAKWSSFSVVIKRVKGLFKTFRWYLVFCAVVIALKLFADINGMAFLLWNNEETKVGRSSYRTFIHHHK